MAIPDKWKLFLKRFLQPDGPEVRPMTPADIKEVVRLIRLHDSDDAKAAQHYFDDKGRFDTDYDDAQHLVLIDPAEKRVVGVSGYGRDPSKEALSVFWVGWTYVNPYFQGKGYGAFLMHVVVEHVKRFGGRKLFVATSSSEKFKGAVSFYERFGFSLEGQLKDYYRDGEDKLILGLKL